MKHFKILAAGGVIVALILSVIFFMKRQPPKVPEPLHSNPAEQRLVDDEDKEEEEDWPAAQDTHSPRSDAADAEDVEALADQKKYMNMSEAVFRELAHQVFETLPTKDELRKLTPEESHLAPEPIIRAGEEMGKVAAALEHNPKLFHAGVEFFQKCAHARDVVVSIKAVCYSQLKQLYKVRMNQEFHDPSISPEVVELGNQL